MYAGLEASSMPMHVIAHFHNRSLLYNSIRRSTHIPTFNVRSMAQGTE